MANYQQVTLPFSTPVPFNLPLSGHEDCLVKINGNIGHGATWFCMNLQTGPGLPSYGPSVGGDVMLHLRPDLGNNVVVRMSRMMGNWSPPNPPDAVPFPLAVGSPFEIMILLPAASTSVPSMARIAFNGNHFAEFALPSALPPALFISVEADPAVSISSLQSFNIPSQSAPAHIPSAGYPNLAAAPHPTSPHYSAPYPQGPMPASAPGYAPGQASSSSGSTFNKVLGAAAALPLVGGALTAATHLPFGKKLGKKMHKAGIGTGMGHVGHKSSSVGYPGLGTGAAGLAVGALGAYALHKKTKKLKKGFKFSGHSSSSSSSSSSSD